MRRQLQFSGVQASGREELFNVVSLALPAIMVSWMMHRAPVALGQVDANGATSIDFNAQGITQRSTQGCADQLRVQGSRPCVQKDQVSHFVAFRQDRILGFQQAFAFSAPGKDTEKAAVLGPSNQRRARKDDLRQIHLLLISSLLAGWPRDQYRPLGLYGAPARVEALVPQRFDHHRPGELANRGGFAIAPAGHISTTRGSRQTAYLQSRLPQFSTTLPWVWPGV